MTHDERVNYLTERLLSEYRNVVSEIEKLKIDSPVQRSVILLDVSSNLESHARNMLARIVFDSHSDRKEKHADRQEHRAVSLRFPSSE